MPPVGGSASTTAGSFRFAQTFGLNIPTPLFRHIFPALVFATQSPYPPCKNIANSRNVMQNFT
jgi:hypothetical protein